MIKRDETFTKKLKSENSLKAEYIFTINELNLKLGIFLTK